MKIIAAILFAIAMGEARADDLQFTVGTQSAYASYAEVRVIDAAGHERFVGSTDKYGRISIQVQPGSYSVVVKVINRELRAPIQITGQSGLRAVSL